MSRVFATPGPAAAKRPARPVLRAPSPKVQPKLRIGRPDDPYEREADSVARQVMRMPHPAAQPMCSDCEEEIQAKRAGGAPSGVTPSVEAEVRGLSGGRPLSPAECGFFEPRMGADLGAVRVHSGARAEGLAAGVGARAFTHGRDVVFGRGEYAPERSGGRQLMAHELAHTLQQTGPDRLQRVPLDEELDAELAAWAKAESKSIDPKNNDYAFNLQEYAWKLIWDDEVMGPIEKPKGAEAIKAWEKKFKKAELLAGKILAAGKVEQKESRAALILDLMAQAGFSAEAVAGASKISDESEAEMVYATVVRDAKSASAATLKLVSEFFIKSKGLTDNPIVDQLTDTTGAFEKSLTNDQLEAVLGPIIAGYENDPILLDLLPEVLVHVKGFRKVFSDWMWREGKGELLFRVLETDYFLEPDYGPSVFVEVGKLDLEKDLSWVYANKQKYYVGFLVQIGKDTGVEIKAPGNLAFATLRKWLDDNTENIGQALAKKYPNDEARWIEVYEQLTDIFFRHVDRGDVKPDLKGRLGKLGAAAPSKTRLKADCDVLATYAMRYFFGIQDADAPTHVGFEPVGYMAVLPQGPDSPPGHAVALMRRGGQYHVVSNKQVFKSPVSEAAADAEKAAAVEAAKTEAMDVYEDPKPAVVQVFYADSEAGGAMPRALADTDASTRRTDLE